MRGTLARVYAERVVSRASVPFGPEPERLRLRLDLAYDGTDFNGWAAQREQRTVEGELVAALTTVFRAAPALRLTVAGRTDAGVHARGQVAHVDVDPDSWSALPGRSSRTPGRAALARLRGVLPPDIVVRSVEVAAPGFDARFSALSRRYRYRICDDPARLDPLRRRDTVLVPDGLDVDAMAEASRPLVGLHDFAAFCKRREGATTIRTLQEYAWRRTEDGIVEARVVADAFCHSMVRALVGAAVAVGEGRYAVDLPAEALAAEVRDPRLKVMPAHGLSLEEVDYPPDGELASRAGVARAMRGPVANSDAVAPVGRRD
jgi:tRNA pseudouridine38-40 synthase